MQANLQSTDIGQTEENRTEDDVAFKLLNQAVFWLFIIWPVASLSTAVYLLVTGQ